MNDAQITAFGQGLRGQLIGRSHVEYDSARKLYNAMIDKRPLLIARCADVADVIAAVNFGRENGLLIAVRGGGHNGPGLGSVDDGLVIDLSQMKGVRTDPKARTVRVGPGCTTGDVDHATHPFGLAVPTGTVSSTGIAGLTLGGGIGYLSRQLGLTIDNLIHAEAGDRCPQRKCQGRTQSEGADALVSDQWRGAARRQNRHAMAHTRCGTADG